MALDTYDNLKTSIGSWLNRRDLTAVIPDFITLAEDVMRRDLRKKTLRKTDFTLDAFAVTLPADCQELRSDPLITSPVTQAGVVKRVTKAEFDAWRAQFQDQVGQPRFCTVVERELLLTPTPGSPYTAEITYFERLIPLGGEVATNSIFIDNKDVYLYGALLQAAPYLKGDDRVPLWQSKFESAIASINKQRENAEFNTGMSTRLPVVFG